VITHLHSALDVARWLQACGAHALHCDSRRVRPGDAFVAWPGAAQDGRRYVAAALDAGAVACVVEREGAEAFGFNDDRIAAVSDLKIHSGEIAHHFYREPSHRLKTVAITGTNGKTSTSWWAAQLLSRLGQPCAVVGTLGMGVPGHVFQRTGLTTPDPVMLQAGLSDFAHQGLKACVMEASSIGLQEGRLNGLRLHVAVFANLTQDHLDYHGSMDAYWAAKRALFDWPGLRVAIVNVDDPHGAQLARDLQDRAGAGALDVWTLSVQGAPARLHIPSSSLTDTGLRFDVVESLPHGASSAAYSVKLPMVGEYNLYNLLSAMAVARALGHALPDAVAACTALTPVPGRMQAVWPDEDAALPLVLVDYAHTPDALEKALQALQPLALQRGGRLWCLVGCGGNRDAGKRPLMAAAAEREASQLVLTSDNPRAENPAHILAQMRDGLLRPDAASINPDRATAIADAVARAEVRDVILLAGKGHEDYQEIQGVKHPFSDVEEACRALSRRLDTQGRANA
jgi:UDP-N-acetylmuramoyl-L-alanyl-D-glutamate--2,6-diaminopimelate ligase